MRQVPERNPLEQNQVDQNQEQVLAQLRESVAFVPALPAAPCKTAMEESDEPEYLCLVWDVQDDPARWSHRVPVPAAEAVAGLRAWIDLLLLDRVAVREVQAARVWKCFDSPDLA